MSCETEPVKVADTEVDEDLLWDGPWPWERRKESLRGRPVEGMTDSKAAGETIDGERECDGDGAWVSVAMAARYWMTFLVLSVLPAPDSPLIENVASVSQEAT
jgi:hypothetical protein